MKQRKIAPGGGYKYHVSIINNKDFVWYNKYQLENLKYYIDKRIKLHNLKSNDKQLYKLIIKKNYQETVNNIYRLLLLSDKQFIYEIQKHNKVDYKQKLSLLFLTIFVIIIFSLNVHINNYNDSQLKKIKIQQEELKKI